jgi:hypothetical protein
MWPQALHTLKLIGDKGPLFRHILKLHDGPLADLVDAIMHGQLPGRDAFRIMCGLLPLRPLIMVDYSKTLEQMLELGKYNPAIVARAINSQVFPVDPNLVGGVHTLVPKIRRLSTDADLLTAIAEFAGKGLRVATHEELLAFGATYPEVVRIGGPIIALGSKGTHDGGEWSMKLHSAGDGTLGVGLVAQVATLSINERFLLFDM